MFPGLSDPLLKLLLPVAGICICLLIMKRRNMHPEDLLLVRPSSQDIILWISIWLAFIGLTDVFLGWRGEFDLDKWSAQPLWASFCKIAGVGIAGPVLEEIIFRGIIFRNLSRYVKNEWVTVILVSAIWAAIHLEYHAGTMLLLFFSGFLLGASMIKSRSLYVPVILHTIWNLYAVW